MQNIYSLLQAQVHLHPDKTALIFENKTFSYREFFASVNRTAYALQNYGVTAGTKVSLLFYNGIRFLATFYALQKLGAVAVLLNYRYQAHEIQSAIASSDSVFFVLDERFITEKHLTIPFMPGIRTISYSPSLHPDIPSLEAAAADAPEHWDYYADPEADSPAIFVFSGGTTSDPKIIVSSQQSLVYSALLHNISNDGYGVYESDVIALFLPLYHTGGLQYAFTFLSLGGTIVLMSKYDQDLLLQVIAQHQVTHTFFIPANLCQQIRTSPFYCKENVHSVRNVILGGSVITGSIVEEAFSLFPHAMLTLGYGCSEGFSTALCLTAEMYEKNPALAGSVGYPTLLSQIRLVDDSGNDVIDDRPGEAIGRSPWMMNGYYRNHKIEPADAWIHSGDILRRDSQGLYYFCDRKKDMVRTAGENVSTFEVESVLDKHPAVQDCAVFGVSHAQLNEVIVAAVVLKSEAIASEAELIAYCKENMASYKKPRKILFLPAIPRTSIGKPDKKRLRQEFESLGKQVF